MLMELHPSIIFATTTLSTNKFIDNSDWDCSILPSKPKTFNKLFDCSATN